MRRNKESKHLKKVMILIFTIIVIPILILSFNMIMGEGITFTSISATTETKKAFRCIKDGNYKKATNYIGFWGFSEDRTTLDIKNIEEEKLRFIEGLNRFFNNDYRDLIGFNNIEFITDDGYTMGSVELEIKDGIETYFFTISISKQSGKLCPMDITQITTAEEHAKTADRLAKELISIIRTHNPG